MVAVIFFSSCAPITPDTDSKFQSKLSSSGVSKLLNLGRWRDPNEGPMEKNVLELLQALLLNIIESKGDEREQSISTFKERLGINASLLQKVSLLIRKEGLILKGRSMKNKFKVSQRWLRSILTVFLGLLSHVVDLIFHFGFCSYPRDTSPLWQRLFLNKPDHLGQIMGSGSVCLGCFENLGAIPGRGSGTW